MGGWNELRHLAPRSSMSFEGHHRRKSNPDDGHHKELKQSSWGAIAPKRSIVPACVYSCPSSTPTACTHAHTNE